MPEEIWKDIPGYEGRYQVSDLGRVKKLGRHEGVLKLKEPPAPKYISFHVRPEDKRLSVHRCVLLAFVGPCPEGKDEVRHLDGNRLNNALSNLAYGSRYENMQDCVQHGRSRRTLSDDAVKDIKDGLAKGESLKCLAKRHGVSKVAIARIRDGVTYRE